MKRLAIIGFGHIGASIAGALQNEKVPTEILAIDRDPEVLKKAKKRGLAKETSTEISSCHMADQVLLSVPVKSCVEILREVTSSMNPAALLLDVASTKGVLLSEFQQIGSPVRYISLHPLAGTEKPGIDSARPGIFEGMPFLFFPVQKADEQALSDVDTIITACKGRKIEVKSVQEHDATLALTIHLPHVLAYALTHLAEESSGTLATDVFSLAGRSFRDSTRVASSDIQMVHDFLSTNTDQTTTAIDRLMDHLERIKKLLAAGNDEELKSVMKNAQKLRERL